MGVDNAEMLCYNYNGNKTHDGRSKGCRAFSSHIPVEKIRGGGKNLELPSQYVFRIARKASSKPAEALLFLRCKFMDKHCRSCCERVWEL